MKKIKFLHGFVVALIIAYIFSFVGNIYLTIYTPAFMDFSDEFYENFIFGYYTQYVSLSFSLIPFAALFYIQKGLNITIKKGFFNRNISNKFKVACTLFLIFGVLSLLWDSTLLIYSKGEFLFVERIGQDILLILMGFGFLIATDFINNGNTIQQENQLTI